MADISSEQLKEIIDRNIESLAKLRDTLDPLSEDSKKLAEEAAKNQKIMETLGVGLKGLSTNLVSAREGTGKYAVSVDILTEGVSGLASKIPVLGGVISGLIKVFGGLAAASLKQNEALITTYQTLSQFGAIDSSNIKTVLDDLQKVGLGVEEANKFTDALKSVSPQLAAFGGSMADGKRRLVEVFNYTLGATEASLMRYGYKTEEMLKYTASYMANLSVTNRQRTKTDLQLNEESTRYLRTLAELSILTGKTRDEADAARREQENDLRFQMYISNLEVTDAKKAERAKQLVQMMTLTYGQQAAEGLKSALVNGGNVVDEFGVGLNLLIGQKGIKGLLNIINTDGASTEQLFEALKNLAPGMLKQFKTFAPIIGVGNKEMEQFFLNIKTYSGATAMMNKDRDVFEKIRKSMEKNATDDRLEELSKLKFAERETRFAFEKLTYMVGSGAVAGLTKFAEVANYLTLQVAKLVKRFGGPDFTGAFLQINNLEEATELLVEEQKKEKELLEQEKKIKEQIAEKEKEIADRTSTITDEKFRHVMTEPIRKEIKELKEQLRDVNISKQQTVENQQRAKSATSTIQKSTATTVPTEGALSGVTVKTNKNQPGLVHREGSELHPNIIKLANELQKGGGEIGFRYVSSANDDYHKNSKSSKHPKGLALDFTVSEHPTPAQFDKIKQFINEKVPGKWYIRDEYNNPSDNSNAPHIHAELQARKGGRFKGPKSGYKVTLHDDELVLPTKSVFPKNKRNIAPVTKTPLKDFFASNEAGQNKTTATPASTMPQAPSLFGQESLSEIFTMLADKLDLMLNQDRRIVAIQEDILRHTKA